MSGTPTGSVVGALDSSDQSGFSPFRIVHFGDVDHTNMKFIILLTVAIFFTSNSVSGQSARASPPTSSKKEPTVARIVERHLRSTGGRRAWASLTSLYSTGTLRSGDRPNGTVEVFQKKPLKYLKIFHGPTAELRLGFDGRRTWSRFKNDPAHFDDPSPSNLAAFVADIDLLAFVNFEARFPGASVKGTEDLADGKAYVIAATPAGSDWVERFYFDVKTGLLVRHDAEFDEDGFRKTTTEYLDLYGPAGNVRVAFRTRAYYDNVLTETFYTEVTPNKPMPNTIFDLPPK